MSTRACRLVVATIVLLTVLAGTAALPAVAAPTAGDGARGANLAATGTMAQVDSSDDDLASGTTFWQGSRLEFDASAILDGGGEIELWRVTDGGQLNQQIRTITVDESGTQVLDTASLSGRYVLRYGGEPVYVSDGRATSAGGTTVSSAAFRVRQQTLSFDWSDPTVYPGQATTLTVESNRARSVVAVSGSDLSFENLTTIVPESAYASDYDARSDEDVLLVSLDERTELDLETSILAAGTASLVFDVTDSSARESAALTVLEPASDRRFRSIERREQVGDVVEADIVCGHCFLVVGGPDQGFLDVVEITDSNGDGNVTLRINTRYAGMFSSASGYPSGVAAYSSPADSVVRYSPSADLEAVQESLNYDVTSLNDLRVQQGLEPSGRFKPIEPGQVRLTLSSSDFIIKRSAYGSGPPLGEGLVVRDETDVKTVTLAPASLAGVSSLGAPGGSGLDVTASTLSDVAGPREQVALGDRLVFRIDVSGVFGYLEAEGTSLDALLSNREEGLSLSLARLRSSGPPETIRIDRVGSELVADPTTDSLYLVLRTGSASSNWLQGGEYRATFALEGIPAEHDEYSTRDGYTGYPYLPPGDSEEVTVTASLAEPTASITSPEGTQAHLTADGALQIQGTTSVAAGTTLAIEAVSAGYAWETQGTTTARSDGTWSSGLDLAEAPGDEFTVTVYSGQQALATETYTVLPPAEESSSSGNSTDDSGGSNDGPADSATAPTAGGSSIAGIPIPDLGGLSGLAVPLGSAMGGLVFVWGMWRLVIRRLIL